MISPKYFVEVLSTHGIDFFTGVPDSLLKDVCAYLMDHSDPEKNIIAANEGNAIGLAAGYYLATGKTPVVYMQNSGLGNAINPLASLTDAEVYNIPLLLLIGWRGEPGVKDEPQHIKQGKVTIPLLDTLGIKHAVLSGQQDKFTVQLYDAISHITKTKEAFAFVVSKGTFEEYTLEQKSIDDFPMSREDAIKITAASINEQDVIVSTTGMISRELFEYRKSMRQGHERDFLTVGSMGHASQIALGIALQKKERYVYCFDGDGAVLMHMGSLAINGSIKPDKFIHIVFNNGAHDSVGGQPTMGLKIDLPKIALSCGYVRSFSISDKESLKKIFEEVKKANGPVFIELKVRKGARKDLGRPDTRPVQNKIQFMEFLNK